jgi:hypothetical protein
LGFLIFSDNSNETAELFCSALQIRNYIMDSVSILALGDVNPQGFPVNGTDTWNATLTGAIADSTILDYETQTWHFVIPNNLEADSALLTIEPSWGATCNLGNQFNVSLKNGATWKITAQDGTQKTWKACIRKTESVNTGWNEMEEVLTYAVYPNPSSDFVFIQLKQKQPSKAKVQLLNAFGQIIQQTNMDDKCSFDLSNLASGVYLVRVEMMGKSTTKKIVKL